MATSVPPSEEDVKKQQAIREQEFARACLFEDLLDGKCPPIGQSNRWYDGLYRLLRDGREERHFDGLAKGWVHNGLSVVETGLYAIHSLERERSRSPLDTRHRINIPEGEGVSIPVIWVCEIFLPSQAKNLNRAISKLGWKDRWVPGYAANDENLLNARQGRTPYAAGWQLGRVDEASRLLPAQHFRSINVVAVEVSPSMTAVVATFALSDSRQTSVDSVWRAEHQPAWDHSSGRRIVLDSRHNGHRRTQRERQDLHAHARKWMHRNFPGSFSEGTQAQGLDQPLVDMLLFNQRNPVSSTLPSEEISSEYRAALGIDQARGLVLTSEDLPGFVLERQDFNLGTSLNRPSSWSIWGQMDTLRKLLGERGDRFVAIADEPMAQALVRMSVLELLYMLHGRYAELRDSAVKSHSRHRGKPLEDTRRTLLQLSLDAGMIAGEILRGVPGHMRFREAAARFRYVVPGHWNTAVSEEAPDFYEQREESQRWLARELVAADEQYRDVLSTAASLGSSIDSFRTQRLSILVAVASFVSSVVAIGISLKLLGG